MQEDDDWKLYHEYRNQATNAELSALKIGPISMFLNIK
jgi:hypothetical protein